MAHVINHAYVNDDIHIINQAMQVYPIYLLIQCHKKLQNSMTI